MSNTVSLLRVQASVIQPTFSYLTYSLSQAGTLLAVAWVASGGDLVGFDPRGRTSTARVIRQSAARPQQLRLGREVGRVILLYLQFFSTSSIVELWTESNINNAPEETATKPPAGAVDGGTPRR